MAASATVGSDAQPITVAASIARRSYLEDGLLVDAHGAVEAIAEIMDGVTSAVQDVSYLAITLDALNELLQARCDKFRSEWKGVRGTIQQCKDIVGALCRQCVKSGSPHSVALPAALAEVFRELEKCIMRTLVTLDTCETRTKRWTNIRSVFVKGGDLKDALKHCGLEWRQALKRLKDELGITDLATMRDLMATILTTWISSPNTHITADFSQTLSMSPSLSLRNSQPQPRVDMARLWRSAVEKYKQNQPPDDVRLFEQFSASLPDNKISSDAMLAFLDCADDDLGEKRQGSQRLRSLRKTVKPIVEGLSVILDASAETASSLGVPGGKGIFAAVGILLRAAERADAALDDLHKLLRCCSFYINRLTMRIQGRLLGSEARELVVDALVKILQMIAIATKVLREGVLKRYLKAIFTKPGEDISHVLNEMRELIDEEERMMIIEILRDVQAVAVNVQESNEDIVEQVHAAKGEVMRQNDANGNIIRNQLTEIRDALQASSRTVPMLATLRGALNTVYPSLSPEDQDRVMAAFMTIFTLAASFTSVASGGNSGTVGALGMIARDPAQVLANFAPMAFSFLFLYMTWKLRALSPSVGLPPGVITIIDLLGKQLVLDEDTFSTWESTHEFILHAFSNRPLGLSYVESGDYALGNTEHLLLAPGEWNRTVHSLIGKVLYMSVVLREPLLRCPYCFSMVTGSEEMLDDGRIICTHCGRPFGAINNHNIKPAIEAASKGDLASGFKSSQAPGLATLDRGMNGNGKTHDTETPSRSAADESNPGTMLSQDTIFNRFTGAKHHGSPMSFDRILVDWLRVRPAVHNLSNAFLDEIPHGKDATAPPSHLPKVEGSDWFAVSNPKVKRSLGISLVHTLKHESVVCCVRFSADGKYLATGRNRSAQIYDTSTGVKTCVLVDPNGPKTGDLYIRSVCFSPDGKYLATGAEDKVILIWEIKSRRIRLTLEGHAQGIYSLDFSRDGLLMVSGSGDRTARIWNLGDGTHKVLAIHKPETIDSGVTFVAISPDARLVATGSLDAIVRIWDVATGMLIKYLPGHKDSVYSLAFTPDGEGLISGSLDKTLKYWDIRSVGMGPQSTGKKLVDKDLCNMNFTGHRDYVLSVAVSHDGKWVVSGSKDRGVQFWDSRTATVQLMLQGHKSSVVSIDLSPTTGLLATGSADWSARIWRYGPPEEVESEEDGRATEEEDMDEAVGEGFMEEEEEVGSGGVDGDEENEWEGESESEGEESNFGEESGGEDGMEWDET